MKAKLFILSIKQFAYSKNILLSASLSLFPLSFNLFVSYVLAINVHYIYMYVFFDVSGSAVTVR